MLTKFIPKPWLIAGALAVALAVAAAMTGIYVKGRADGRAVVAAKLAEDRITILRDGKAIDYEVLAADDDALCGLLGGCGVPDSPDRD